MEEINGVSRPPRPEPARENRRAEQQEEPPKETARSESERPPERRGSQVDAEA